MKKATRPDRALLESIVAKLEDPVGDLVRKDAQFTKLGLNEADYRTPDAVIEILLLHPALLQRPIVMKGDMAIIGRPKDRVRQLLS